MRSILLLFVSVAALAACAPERPDAPANPDAVPAPNVSEVPSVQVIVDNVYPRRNTLRGNAEFAGVAQRAAGRPQAGIVEDARRDKFATTVLFDADLQSGVYELDADIRQPSGVAEHSLLRFEARDADLAFPRIDLGVTEGGDPWRATGEAAVTVEDVDADGFRGVRLRFRVDAAGAYRASFFPAAGREGRLDPDAMGQAAIGGIGLRRVGSGP